MMTINPPRRSGVPLCLGLAGVTILIAVSVAWPSSPEHSGLWSITLVVGVLACILSVVSAIIENAP